MPFLHNFLSHLSKKTGVKWCGVHDGNTPEEPSAKTDLRNSGVGILTLEMFLGQHGPRDW